MLLAQAGRGQTKAPDASEFTVLWGIAEGTPSSKQVFDVVVIAAPLEQTKIKFSNIELRGGASLDREFFDWHVTVVEAASVNTSQFEPHYAPHLGAPLPKVLLTTTNSSTNAKTPWVVVQPLGKHVKGTVPKNVCVARFLCNF